MYLSQKENLEFLLYNSLGQIVYSKNQSAEAGRFNDKINISLLSNGVYLLKVNEGNIYFTKKFVKQN